jgi:dTDP-4-dehydrorhamnose 3,5-epimerase
VIITGLEIPGLVLIQPRRFADQRGYFVETWNKRTLAAAGIEVDFVQDNASFSSETGTIRGLHFQRGSAAQAKLVRVVRGSIFDVAVDLRRSSPNFGQWAGATLTADAGEQLYVPIGFAHGFCTLEPSTEVAYKVSAFYSPEHDDGIIWDDPDIGISWPLNGAAPVLSDKDSRLPRLAETEGLF